MKSILRLSLILTATLCLVFSSENAFAKKKKKKSSETTKTEETTTTTTTEESKEDTSSTSGGSSYGGNEPYGMAGCGLWTYVIKDKGRWPQLGVVALGMAIFPNFQTSGITSGTSNCVKKSADMAQNEQKVFVSVNLNSLSKEAAQGQGEHLYNLAEIFGCENHQAFASLSQEKYEKIFNNQNPDEVLSNYLNEIQSNKELSQSCTRALSKN